jgi:hypothetical protein
MLTYPGSIFGDGGTGVYSIVFSSREDSDTDNGDSIEWGVPVAATEATSALLRSTKSGNEIRVIRSAQLHKNNRYRPERGIRYDGRYIIKRYKTVDVDRQEYRFRLERCRGQAPIRCANDNSRRPTIFEIDEYERQMSRG